MITQQEEIPTGIYEPVPADLPAAAEGAADASGKAAERPAPNPESPASGMESVSEVRVEDGAGDPLPGDPVRVVAGESFDPSKADSSALRAAFEKVILERDDYLDLSRRVQAELGNYRKRVQRDMASYKREALRGFLCEFLGAFDDLDRAISEAAKDPLAAAYRQGIVLVRENLWRTLAKAGVTEISAQGQPFDPCIHEAIATIPSADHPAGTILELMQPGYSLDGFVLRPARVVVSMASC